MTRITNIRHEGLKARDRDVALGAKTLVLGPVGSGKSTLADAVRFGFLGYVPDLGADEASTGMLMSGGHLEVEMALDGGRIVYRTLDRKGAKFVNGAEASWLEEPGTTQASLAIIALVGGNKQEAAEHLDLRQLLRAGPSARAKKIEALLEPSCTGDDGKWAWALTVMRLDGREEGRLPVRLEDAEHIAAAVVAVLPPRVRSLLAGIEQEVVEHGITHTLAEATKNKNAARAKSASAVQARAAIEKRLGEMPRPSTAKAELEERLAAAEKARTEAERDLREHGRIAKLIQAEPAGVPVEREPTDEEMAANETTAMRLRAEAAAVVVPAVVVVSERAHEEAMSIYRKALRSPWRRVEELAVEAGVYADELRALARENGGDTEDLCALAAIKRKEYEQALLEAEAIRVIAAEREKERAALHAEYEAAYKAGREMFRAKAAWLHAHAAAEKASGLRSALPQRSVEELTVVAEEARASVVTARELIALLVEADARRSEMEALARNVAAADEERDYYSAAEWALKRLRERDLGSRAGGLVDGMRVFLRGCGRSEEPYIRPAKGDIEFGWTRGAKEIPVQVLSGGESVQFCAALAAAVIAQRAPECRILLLEAAELGSSSVLLDSLRGCESILSVGMVDQVVVATNAAVDVAPLVARDWTVVSTEENA